MYTVGIDEAGRGALAGPVVVAAVAVPRSFNHRLKTLPRLRDSKQLSPLQREVWYRHIQEHPYVFYATARVYPKRIDTINIAQSANLAASRALERLVYYLGSGEKFPVKVLLDGSLYLSYRKHQALSARTIVKGDELKTAIKLASIVAKVTRDKYLVALHKRYPEYGLQFHKGYGTARHFRAITQHGIAEIHRLTYLKRYPNLKFKTRVT
ncbi:MAG: hypothetical protein A2Y84_01225 [Candidatus Colwellbacteria bacterium RBG_13_48_8]|uniref:Ribonuclease n=1 Tax=Candidatus Colwellbacteria bacterium RBG_13_48_8 TaxID=1797685 RepID=A0A1G1YXP3_9BACT|nr:MAG: hypothetical protein A2Y84_01225 [Candidatus Colwellbacteria bacterium RBG_13_48_8]